VNRFVPQATPILRLPHDIHGRPHNFPTRLILGESKLTMKQNVQYLQQLAALYYDKYGVLLFAVLLALVVIGLLVLRRLSGAVFSA